MVDQDFGSVVVKMLGGFFEDLKMFRGSCRAKLKIDRFHSRDLSHVKTQPQTITLIDAMQKNYRGHGVMLLVPPLIFFPLLIFKCLLV